MEQDMNAELEENIRSLEDALQTDHAAQTVRAPRIDHDGQFATLCVSRTPCVSTTVMCKCCRLLDLLHVVSSLLYTQSC